VQTQCRELCNAISCNVGVRGAGVLTYGAGIVLTYCADMVLTYGAGIVLTYGADIRCTSFADITCFDVAWRVGVVWCGVLWCRSWFLMAATASHLTQHPECLVANNDCGQLDFAGNRGFYIVLVLSIATNLSTALAVSGPLTLIKSQFASTLDQLVPCECVGHHHVFIAQLPFKCLLCCSYSRVPKVGWGCSCLFIERATLHTLPCLFSHAPSTLNCTLGSGTS
jgi:hypothetical protein